VTNQHGVPVKRSAELPTHANALVRFADGQRHATFDKDTATPPSPRQKTKPAARHDQRQDDLF